MCRLAVARVSCDGREHQVRWADGELRVPGHPDLESEKILRALAGEDYACLDVLEAWEVHADDLRVLVLASRGPADPVAVRLDQPGPAGWTGRTGRSAAARMQRRRSAVTAVLGGAAPASREREDPLATLLSLGGPMQTRLTATVAAAWRERLRDGAAPADTATALPDAPVLPDATVATAAATIEAARPALHAALYGRVVATLRAWTGRPDLRVALTMIGESDGRPWRPTATGSRWNCRSAGSATCGPGAWVPAGIGSSWPRRQPGTGGPCPPWPPTWARPPRSRSPAPAWHLSMITVKRRRDRGTR